MKLKNIFIVLSLVFVPFFLSGCQLLQNAGNLTPAILIPDLTQDQVEAFMLEVTTNMEAATNYKTTIDTDGYLITVLIDGENSLLDGTTAEGSIKNYVVDGATYLYSDGRWLKFTSTVPTDDTSSYDEELFKEEVKDFVYVRKEACPDGLGTCYYFEVDREESTGKLFVNAVTKLPVTYEHNEDGVSTTVTYDFATADRVVLPEEAENATTL